MSELSERWQKLRGELGAFTNDLNNLAIRYEPLADVEEKAYRRGYDKGYQEALAKTKAEMCNGCNHKYLSEKNCEYTDILCLYDKLDYNKKDIIGRLLRSLAVK